MSRRGGGAAGEEEEDLRRLLLRLLWDEDKDMEVDELEGECGDDLGLKGSILGCLEEDLGWGGPA